MRFKDRKASKPNRYKATPEGSDPFYVVLERADEPTEEGTPLNAAVLNAMASTSSLSPAMMDDGSAPTGLDNSIDEGEYDTYSAVHAVLYTKQKLTEKEQAQARENIGIDGTGYSMPCVMDYGAKGDGVTDDTVAFQNALAAERVVTVPGGTYVLSDTLVIRENCGLELSQDTVLKFTQTEGNCIEMRGSAVLRGNHAVIVAAYGLTGNVISMDTAQDGTTTNSIPPYEKECPQFKRQRFVYDVNIVKPNSSGFNRPEHNDDVNNVKCSGTAIYAHGSGANTVTFLWGVVMSGIRIAGGFSYGIRAVNTNNGWNHDMRIEAVIEACEVGVALENCNGAHLNVTVQPCTTNNWPNDGTKYAKQGVCLKNSEYVDMMRSRVWDWHYAVDGAENQHIALYGNCSGLLLDDFLVHEHPNTDIRDEIYTDTPSNFDTMTILQEPGNKNFKSVGNKPYFNNGTNDMRLALESEIVTPADGYYTYEDNFTNLVESAGFTDGGYISNSGSVGSDYANRTLTGYIPVKTGAKIIRIGGTGVSFDEYGCAINFYDADKNLLGCYPYNKLNDGGGWGTTVEDEKAAVAWNTSGTSHGTNGVYMQVAAKGEGENLIVTIDEPLDYTATWHGEPKRLDDSIKVKAENVVEMEAVIDARLRALGLIT